MRRVALWLMLAAIALSGVAFVGCGGPGKPTGSGDESGARTPGVPPAKPPVAPAGTALSSIEIVGSIHGVLDGTLKESDLVELKPADLIAGLGSGTLSGLETTGEMMVFGDTAYVRVTDEAAGWPTESSEMGVQTPFAVAIRRGERPADLVHEAGGTAPRTLEDILRGLVDQYQVPLAVYGIGEFLTVEGTALKQAPIEGENILAEENREKYFLPTIERGHEVLAFFGVVAADSSQPWSPAKELFERIIYANFANKGAGGVSYHVHAAVIDEIPQDAATLDHGSFHAAARGATVKEIFHLLGQSRMESGTIIVYALGKVAQPIRIEIGVEGGVGMLLPVGR